MREGPSVVGLVFGPSGAQMAAILGCNIPVPRVVVINVEDVAGIGVDPETEV